MIEQIQDILKSKGYSDELIKYAINLFPEMIKLFGEKRTINFFREYTLIPRDRIGQNSGATNKDEKKIEFDWSLKNFHEALTLFIHEAAHAIGSLETDNDNFLMEGFRYRESFLNKFEEAVVSERQNELEYGELNYTYCKINNVENKEDFHKNDFKTQPTHKYTINNVLYKNIQILLGNSKDLILKMMFADSLEEKSKICNQIIKTLKEQLSENDFLKLKDCINVFTLNYSYKGDKTTLSAYIKDDNNFDDSITREEYKELLKENFPKNIIYCMERNLENKNIFDAIDDLCELTIDVIYSRLTDSEYDEFSSVKEACEYFSKIYNNADRLFAKTNKLKEALLDKIKALAPSLFYKIDNVGFDEEELFVILTKIISTHDFKENDLENIRINIDGIVTISTSNNHQYLVEKKPIHSDDDTLTLFEDMSLVQPIKYEIVIKEIVREQTDQKEEQPEVNIKMRGVDRDE